MKRAIQGPFHCDTFIILFWSSPEGAVRKTEIQQAGFRYSGIYFEQPFGLRGRAKWPFGPFSDTRKYKGNSIFKKALRGLFKYRIPFIFALTREAKYKRIAADIAAFCFENRLQTRSYEGVICFKRAVKVESSSS